MRFGTCIGQGGVAVGALGFGTVVVHPFLEKIKQDATWRGLWTSPFGLPMVSGRLVFRQPCASLSRSFRVFPRSVWGILLLESSLVIRLQDVLLLSVSFRTHL